LENSNRSKEDGVMYYRIKYPSTYRLSVELRNAVLYQKVVPSESSRDHLEP